MRAVQKNNASNENAARDRILSIERRDALVDGSGTNSIDRNLAFHIKNCTSCVHRSSAHTPPAGYKERVGSLTRNQFTVFPYTTNVFCYFDVQTEYRCLCSRYR